MCPCCVSPLRGVKQLKHAHKGTQAFSAACKRTAEEDKKKGEVGKQSYALSAAVLTLLSVSASACAAECVCVSGTFHDISQRLESFQGKVFSPYGFDAQHHDGSSSAGAGHTGST